MINKKNMKLILVIIWMIVIFINSSMESNISDNQSKQLINKIINVVNKNNEDKNLVEKLNYPLRKLAHFTTYFILSFLIVNYLKEYNLNKNKLLLYTIAICFLYASTDEAHQLFIKGRSGEVLDVLIDVSGSLFYIIIYYSKGVFKNEK